MSLSKCINSGDKPSKKLSISPNRNPLLNPVVLERFFELCLLEDVPQFRLVCRLWHSTSLTRFRDGFTPKICQIRDCDNVKEGEGDIYPMKPHQRLQWITMKDQLEVGEKSFKSFHLCQYQFCASYSDFGERVLGTWNKTEYKRLYKNMKNFFKLRGKWIRKLELVRCLVKNVDAFKKALFEDLPNLEELKVKQLLTVMQNEYHHGLDEGWEGEKVKVHPKMRSLIVEGYMGVLFTLNWRLLFTYFPYIEKLELKGFACKDDLYLMVGMLEEMHKNGCPHKCPITDLRLIEFVPQNEGVIRRLFQLPMMKLKTLHFDIQGCEDDKLTILPTVIQLHGKSLETLWLTKSDFPKLQDRRTSFLPPYENFPFQEAPLISLTELKLEGFVCRRLNFLEKVPNLKVLKVLQETHGTIEIPKVMEARLPHVHEFQFIDRDPKHYLRLEKAMELFVRVMPNVTTFCGQLITPSFHVLCQNWRGLKHLKIFSSAWKDKGITKIGDEELTGIVKGREQRLPNITDLKDLRILTLKNMGKISDLAVLEGFVKVPLLHTLEVKLSKETSKEALEALLGHIPNVKFE